MLNYQRVIIVHQFRQPSPFHPPPKKPVFVLKSSASTWDDSPYMKTIFPATLRPEVVWKDSPDLLPGYYHILPLFLLLKCPHVWWSWVISRNISIFAGVIWVIAADSPKFPTISHLFLANTPGSFQPLFPAAGWPSCNAHPVEQHLHPGSMNRSFHSLPVNLWNIIIFKIGKPLKYIWAMASSSQRCIRILLHQSTWLSLWLMVKSNLWLGTIYIYINPIKLLYSSLEGTKTNKGI